jgi:hypothetical protein
MEVAGRANRIWTAPDTFLQSNDPLADDCKSNEFCFVPIRAACESPESIVFAILDMEPVYAAGKLAWTAATMFPVHQEKDGRG